MRYAWQFRKVKGDESTEDKDDLPGATITHVHALSLSKSLGVIPGIVAAGVSYYFNKSVLWALLHFVLSYAYLTYKALDVLLSGKV